MVNICESLINVVSRNKPKWPIGLNQKVRGQVRVFDCHLYVDVAPPADRRDLTHTGIYAERGKPEFLPFFRESEP